MVSIIIPVYNGENYLKRCLDSVINQLYRNVEIIIVNDGSTDRTHFICQYYRKIDDRIRYFLLDKNKGLPYARNIGISNAKGEFLIFVDADDILPNNSVGVRVDLIGDNDLLIGNYETLEMDGNVHYSKICTEKVVDNDDILNNLFLDYGYGFQGYRWNKLFRKSIINLCNFSYEKLIYNEDRLFVCIYLLKCKKVKLIPHVVYRYIKNPGSMMNPASFNYKILSGLQTFNIMCKMLKKTNIYAYHMCCLNAYYSADSIYWAIPSKDYILKNKVREYMLKYRDKFFEASEEFALKIAKVKMNEEKYE